jgi:hypothetical protein
MILVKYLFCAIRCICLYVHIGKYGKYAAGKYVMDCNPLVLLLRINISVTLSLLCYLVSLCVKFRNNWMDTSVHFTVTI